MTIYKRHPKSVFSNPLFASHFEASFAEQAAKAPYDIVKTGEHSWRIEAELPGFGLEDIDITQDGKKLLVVAQKAGHQKKDDAGKTEDTAATNVAAETSEEHVIRGRQQGTRKLEFALGAHIDVTAASLDKGVLVINLERNLPDELQPRKIAVAGA